MVIAEARKESIIMEDATPAFADEGGPKKAYGLRWEATEDLVKDIIRQLVHRGRQGALVDDNLAHLDLGGVFSYSRFIDDSGWPKNARCRSRNWGLRRIWGGRRGRRMGKKDWRWQILSIVFDFTILTNGSNCNVNKTFDEFFLWLLICRPI